MYFLEHYLCLISPIYLHLTLLNVANVKMARIHENTLKWLNEQLKKKHTKNKNDSVVVEEDLKHCIYCYKLFLNATFVVKHIFKRHAEQFLRQHRRFIDTTKAEVDSDPQSFLINYLKSEFSNLKTELEILKQAVRHNLHVSDPIKYQVTCSTGCQESKGAGDGLNINESADKALSRKPEENEENINRGDFIKLQAKVEEMSQMYKEVLSLDDKRILHEDNICKRLRNELLTDFETLLIRYQVENSELKEHFFQLKNDLQKLEQSVELNAKKLKSPEVLKEIENKIENKIEDFYANYGIVDARYATSAKGSKKISNDKTLNVHRSNRRKKNIYTCNSQSLSLQKRQLDMQLKPNDPPLLTCPSEIYNASTSSISEADSFQKLGIERAKILFEEKLKDLSISSKTKQLTAEEFETKMQLVKAQKQLLCQKYNNFQQVYEKVDSHANKLVKSQSNTKVRKQLRFSDSSMSTRASESKSKVRHEHSIEISSPIEKMNLGLKQQSEFGACGDSTDVRNDCNSTYIKSSGRGDCALGIFDEIPDRFNFPGDFISLPQNQPPSNSFAEFHLFDNPHKSVCPKTPNYFETVDELSELSADETD